MKLFAALRSQHRRVSRGLSFPDAIKFVFVHGAMRPALADATLEGVKVREVFAEGARAGLRHAVANLVDALLDLARLFVFLGWRLPVALKPPALRQMVQRAAQVGGGERFVEGAGPQDVRQQLLGLLECATLLLGLEPRRSENRTVEGVECVLQGFGPADLILGKQSVALEQVKYFALPSRAALDLAALRAHLAALQVS